MTIRIMNLPNCDVEFEVEYSVKWDDYNLDDDVYFEDLYIDGSRLPAADLFMNIRGEKMSLKDYFQLELSEMATVLMAAE